MKIRLSESFKAKLKDQVRFISKDKPGAAKKFKAGLMSRINEISLMPFKNRKSVFFNSEDIRDLIYKGYIIVYWINKDANCIDVFGFTRYKENPFE